jgi:hypothetical protein
LKKTPVVLLGYNRPEKFSKLIGSLESSRPESLIVVIDGPKEGNSQDIIKVLETQNVAQSISWTEDIEFIFRPTNLGLRESVEDAVTYATEKYGRAIMLEDDARPGPVWIPYATMMLDSFEGAEKIQHVSGYDLVPPAFLSSPRRGSRLSRYPESYAWATWQSAWKKYDPHLEWALNASVTDLERIVGSKISALRWKQNFLDANAGRISTWAYRWLATVWSQDAFMLSPNANLVTYDGYTDGTHTFLKPGWTELERFDGDYTTLFEANPKLDFAADKWAARHVYSETACGVSRGVIISAVLEIRKNYRAFKKSRIR